MKSKKYSKPIFILLLIVSLALACRMPNLISASQAEPTAPKKPALVILSSSPTPEAIPEPTAESETMCKVKTGIDTGLLNLRDGPAMSYKPLEVLHEGDPLTRLEDPARDGWIKIKSLSIQGWVNSNYVTCEENKP